jgi:hypothetical protein
MRRKHEFLDASQSWIEGLLTSERSPQDTIKRISRKIGQTLTTDALVYATVAYERADSVQPCVKMGWFDVNHMDQEGSTPLMYACAAGDLPMVEALVMAGADASMTMEDGTSPLVIAGTVRHFHVLQFLLCQGVNTGLDKVLTSAVIKSDLEILQVSCLYLGVYRLNATNPFNIS